MGKAYLIGADSIVDQVGDHKGCDAIEAAFVRHGIHPRKLTIDPLKAGWDTPVNPDHFRSGLAPVEALSRALALIGTGDASAVVIEGEDLLRTAYRRHERNALMRVYGDDYPLTTAYVDVAKAFMAAHRISEHRFKQTAEFLYRNYEKTYTRTHGKPPRDSKWFSPLNDLFRGVDCANPNVDFSGRLIVANREVADCCERDGEKRIEVLAAGVGKIGDGPEHLEEIARYHHLNQAYVRACETAGVEFTSEFLSGNALLEVYTCYPVVPMGFLLAAEMVSSVEQMPALLEGYEVTVTGGMNLAGAPWNNPALHALIAMVKKMKSGPHRYGAVHGNGGLGFGQGVAILGRV